MIIYTATQTIWKLKYAAIWRLMLVSRSWRPCFRLSSQDFSDCPAYTHLKVISIDFCFLALGCINGITYFSLFISLQGFKEQEEC
jgi:hypothetical protein